MKTAKQKLAALTAAVAELQAVQRIRSRPSDVLEQPDGTLLLSGRTAAMIRLIAKVKHWSFHKTTTWALRTFLPKVMAEMKGGAR